MNPFEMVLGVVFFGGITAMVIAWISAKSDERKALAHRPDVTPEQLVHLEERIRVLEKIVTDHDYDLKRELRELEH